VLQRCYVGCVEIGGFLEVRRDSYCADRLSGTQITLQGRRPANGMLGVLGMDDRDVDITNSPTRPLSGPLASLAIHTTERGQYCSVMITEQHLKFSGSQWLCHEQP
jgi:hypothetical protein